MEEETSQNTIKTFTDPVTGKFVKGNPGGGRPKDTPETKLLKKASKEIIAEYKEALAEALPMIQPIFIAKAMEGDMVAIKEIHDRVMDKAKQPTDITSNGESINQVLVKFIDAETNDTTEDNRDTQGV